MKNALNWFEIPAKDFERAKNFYAQIFETELETLTMEEFGSQMAFLPADMENGVGGAIASGPGCEPSQVGSLIYLNGGDDLNYRLNLVEKAGGSVILPKTSLGEHGNMAYFIDSEGNRVALHSPN